MAEALIEDRGTTIATTEASREPERSTGAQAGGAEALLLEDLLIEDVSIDGMCGVY